MSPSKRQPSKQERAKRTRARRDALAARVEHAAESPAASSSSDSGSARSAGRARRPGLLSTLLGGGAAGGGGASRGDAASARPAREPGPLMKRVTEIAGGKPGSVAVLAAVVLAFLSFLFVTFGPLAAVDDRGDAIPQRFGGVYLATRSVLTGETVERETTTVFDAGGPGVLLLYAVPLLVAIVAFIMYRRAERSTPLTISMLAMAVLVFAGIGFVYFLSLIALGVGTYQARKAELPARMAERAAARGEDEELAEDEEWDDEELAEDEEWDEDEELAEDEEYVDEEEVVDGDEEEPEEQPKK